MKLSKIKIVAIITVLLLAGASQGIAQSESFYGAYQTCPFACEAIQINRDGTFVHRLDGDLFNDIRSRGTWKFVGKNRIRALTPSTNTDPQVAETVAKRSDSFLVIFIDAVGGLISGAKVSGSVNGVPFERESNDEGVVEIPKCEQFNVAIGGSRNYRGTHRIKNPNANEFAVTLTTEQMFETRIDEIWQVRDGCLYFVESNGSVNKNYCLRKLSRKKAESIFGTAMPNTRLERTRR